MKGLVKYYCCCILIIICLATSPAQQPALQSVNVVEAPGTNIVLEERICDDYLVVRVTSDAHNWWMMKLTGVKGKTITIGFNMVDKGDVSKWTSLQPVYTYADPNELSTFEWFTKVKGRWHSGDALRSEDQRDAGDREVPIQQVIPAESAKEFLSPNGQYWEPWHRIAATKILPDLNIFHMTYTFTQNDVFIAMRYPFSNDLLHNYIKAIKNNNKNNMMVKIVGKTREERDLSVIEVKSNRFINRYPNTIIIYSREHASEPDGSWAIYGIVNSILDERITEYPTLILIPIIDPDGVNANIYEGKILRTFDTFDKSPESEAWMRYIATLTCNHQYVDVSLNLHNVESGEANNFWMAHADLFNKDTIVKIKARVEQLAQRDGYSISPANPLLTFQGTRLEGWISRNIGSVDVFYEINSQASSHQLTLQRLQVIGSLLIRVIDDSIHNDNWLTECRQRQDEKRALLASRWNLPSGVGH